MTRLLGFFVGMLFIFSPTVSFAEDSSLEIPIFLGEGKSIRYININPEVKLSGKDFVHNIISPPFSTNGFCFGYSTDSPIHLPESENAPALVWSAYEANTRAGEVYIAFAESLRNPGALRWEDVVTLRFPQRPEDNGIAWYGHEVALRDITSDGLPELLVGARFAKGGGGENFYYNGKTLAGLRGGPKNVVDAVSMATAQVAAASGGELGFSLALHGSKGSGEIVSRKSTGVHGETYAGAVAFLPAGTRGTVVINDEAFIPGNSDTGEDFARTLTSVESVSGPPWLLAGSYSEALSYGTQALSGKVWRIDQGRSTELFSLKELFSSLKQNTHVFRHLMPDLLRSPNKDYLVVGVAANTYSFLNQSGIAIKDMTTGNMLFLSSSQLYASALGWSLNTSLDINGDGYTDIIAGAPLLIAGDGYPHGAVLVVDGKSTVEALSTSGNGKDIQAKLLMMSEHDLYALGSKRRFAAFYTREGEPWIAVGAPGSVPPNDNGALVLINLSGVLKKQ